MKTLHLLFGILGFATFLATGLYMKTSFPDAYNGNEVAHMMFRANHIYLLLSAFINLMAGLYLQQYSTSLARLAQTCGSVLLLAATGLFFSAFCLETANGNFERPLSYYGVISTVVAMGAHAVAAIASATHQAKAIP